MSMAAFSEPTLSQWLAMGGYGFYVWSSVGSVLAALVAERVAVAWQRKQRLAALREAREAAEDARAAQAEWPRPGGGETRP